MAEWFKKFKFEIRSDMIKSAILFGIVVTLSLVLRPLIGAGNAMALANSFMIVPLSLSNDYTTKAPYNFAYFSIVYTGLGVAAWISGFNIALKGVMFFIVVIFLSYSLNRGRRKPLYLQFSINFIFMVYYPAEGFEVVVRLIILEAAVVALMIAQLIFNRQRYRKVIRFSVRRVSDEVEEFADLSFAGLSKEDNEATFKEIEQRITASSSLFFTKFDQIKQWDRGLQYLRLLSVLRRLSHIIYRYNKNGKGLYEKTYLKMKEIIKGVDNFNFEKKSFDNILEDFGKIRLASVDDSEGIELDSELAVFEADKDVAGATVKAGHRFNKYQFLFSLKTAIMAAAGVVILEAIGLPYVYWYPINVCVLSQPFSEFGRKKSAERILNTVLATGMLFIAFHITDYTWVHAIILVGLVVLGDTIFKFNFFTIYAAFMALLLGQMMGRGSITELSVLRLIYVVGTSALVILVDSFVSTRKMQSVFESMLKDAETINKAIAADILSEDFSGRKLKELFDRKFNVNSGILNMRAYYQESVLDEYALNEQSLMRMYNVISEYMVNNPDQAGEISELFRQCLADNDFDNLTGKIPGKYVYAVLVLYDMYEALEESEKLIMEMRRNLKYDTSADVDTAVF